MFAILSGDEDVPLVISVPHAGTAMPPHANKLLAEAYQQFKPDTDWFVDKLYSFAPQMGVTMVVADYSRYLIDLNRPPGGEKLYEAARQETGLVPLTSFDGTELYPAGPPSEQIIHERIDAYHRPYYDQLTHLLEQRKQHHGYAVLVDAHSIARRVPKIQQAAFPDMIIGTRDGSSCAPIFEQITFDLLGADGWNVTLNNPFKGGNITRHFGTPHNGIHAIQLEMSQDTYMDDPKDGFLEARALQVVATLKKWITQLIETKP